MPAISATRTRSPTFKEIEIAHGAPSVLIYNAIQLVAKPFAELTPEDFEQSRRSTCFGAMVTAQAALPGMLSRGGGTIIFTGATASIKASARFAAFASAKFALSLDPPFITKVG
jgi:NAD(P)-dependent dehydrogenase (short-subunit alcohol dehydrogenase family)